jgi:hypothetical protein
MANSPENDLKESSAAGSAPSSSSLTNHLGGRAQTVRDPFAEGLGREIGAVKLRSRHPTPGSYTGFVTCGVNLFEHALARIEIATPHHGVTIDRATRRLVGDPLVPEFATLDVQGSGC